MRYEDKILIELEYWKRKMLKKPTMFGKMTKGVQNQINNKIPERVHNIITTSIKHMTRTVLMGSELTTKKPLSKDISWNEKEMLAKEKLQLYKKTAAIEGAGTGAGGILIGMADFPLLLGIKFKFLYDIASIYGYDVRNFKERLFILYVFQLAFSSDMKRKEAYLKVANFNAFQQPIDINHLDWRSFQQEYRDYMDVAKLLQMLPGIGAVFGAYANFRLMDRLGETAINSYRLRLQKEGILY